MRVTAAGGQVHGCGSAQEKVWGLSSQEGTRAGVSPPRAARLVRPTCPIKSAWPLRCPLWGDVKNRPPPPKSAPAADHNDGKFSGRNPPEWTRRFLFATQDDLDTNSGWSPYYRHYSVAPVSENRAEHAANDLPSHFRSNRTGGALDEAPPGALTVRVNHRQNQTRRPARRPGPNRWRAAAGRPTQATRPQSVVLSVSRTRIRDRPSSRTRRPPGSLITPARSSAGVAGPMRLAGGTTKAR